VEKAPERGTRFALDYRSQDDEWNVWREQKVREAKGVKEQGLDKV
jgi:hypothetical protein